MKLMLLTVMLCNALTITNPSQDIIKENNQNVFVNEKYNDVITLQSPYDDNIGILLVDNLQDTELSNESIHSTMGKSQIIDNIINYNSQTNAPAYDTTQLIAKYNTVVNAKTEQVDSNIISKINANYITDKSLIDGYNYLGVSNTDSYIDVYDEASTDGFIIGKMPDGCASEIIDENENFYKIKSGDVEGYVEKQYILTKKEANIKAIQTMNENLKINIDNAKVYEDQELTKEEITIEKDSMINFTEKNNGVYKVNIDDVEGYISENDVTLTYTLPTAILLYTELEKTQIETVDYAVQFLGNPYVWGGTNLTNGCDCSGFVQQIYKQFGYSLNRHSSDQATQGTEVSLQDLQPGDLVFYDHKGAGIDHVAMYIGNGQIIHASNKRDGIKISKVFYIKPVKAVRILN